MKKNSCLFKFLCVLQSLFLLVPFASALPHGEVVTSGSVSFDRSGNSLTVNQASGAAIVQYGHFGIAAGENVTFNQPGSGSSILNRVVGGGPSTIAGSLNANGNVFLINPSGILFAPGSQINVHGLVASGMQMSDADFLSGNMRFSGGGGSVVNQGSINAAFVYLVGGVVRNDGSINAGSVALAAGQQSVVIGNAGGGQIQLIIDGKEVGPKGQALTDDTETTDTASDETGGSTVGDATADGSGTDATELVTATDGLQTGDVVNAGTINASQTIGGEIALGGEAIAQYGTVTANGLDGAGGHIGISASEVILLSNNSVTTANAGLTGTGGEIRIFAEDRTGVSSGATLEARGGSESGDGGFVEVSGLRYVELNTLVDVSSPTGKDGALLIDPTDILIDTDVGVISSGGSFDPTPPPHNWMPVGNMSVITAADLNAQLNIGDVFINTMSAGAGTGNITIDDSVLGTFPDALFLNTTGNTLFLDAEHDIQILVPVRPSVTGDFFNLMGTAGNNINIIGDIETGGGFVDLAANADLFVDMTTTINTSNPLGIGGSIFLKADNDEMGGGFLSQDGQLTSGGGDIDIRGNLVNLSDFGDTDSAGGNIFIQGKIGTSISHSIHAQNPMGMNGGHIIITDDENIELGTSDLVVETIGSGAIVVAADSDLSGAGDIFLSEPAGSKDFITVDGNIFFFANEIEVPGFMRLTAAGAGGISVFTETELRNDGQFTGHDVLIESLGTVTHNGLIFAQGVAAIEAVGSVSGSGMIQGAEVGLEVDHFLGQMPISMNPDAVFKVLVNDPASSMNDPINLNPAAVEGDIIGPDLDLGNPEPDLLFLVAQASILCPVIPPPVIPPPPVVPPVTPPPEVQEAPPPPVEPPPAPAFPEIVIRRLLLTPARVAQLDEVEGGKEKLAQFNEFYFLTTAMVVSEYGRRLDLNSIDHLAFGTANIGGPGLADFPAEAKKTIYFGKIKSFDQLETSSVRIRSDR